VAARKQQPAREDGKEIPFALKRTLISMSVKTKIEDDKTALVRGAEATLWRRLLSSSEAEAPPRATDAEISEDEECRKAGCFLSGCV